MTGHSEAWAIWFVGLPGCGKSTLAKAVAHYLADRGTNTVLLEMDGRRKEYFSNPTYSAEEREAAYAMFVDEAVGLVAEGNNVLMDGAAPEASMRRGARARIGRFAEVFIQCDLDVAMRRESERPGGEVMGGLYEKALRRKETGEQFEGLGEVIGVDVEFEMDPEAEFVIDNTHISREETLGKTLHFLDTWLASA